MVDDFWGSWTFDLGLQGSAAQVTNSTKYVNLGAVTGSKSFTFSPDNMVVNDQTGSQGQVTFIYNQGIEFIIDEQMWWANFFFNADGYSCDKTSVGYVHDTVGRNWARIQGTRQTDAAIEVQPFSQPDELAALERSARDGPSRFRKFRKNQEFINQVNSRTNGLWTAKHNPLNEQYTVAEMNLRSGSLMPEEMRPKLNANRDLKQTVAQAIKKHQEIIQETGLPETLDWRNVEGQNFVSPVDDQGGCGSCYSFASMGMMESRIRVQTNNQQQPIFSEQEIITCGRDKTYNQGCVGGFAYLTAGKYAQDFGVVEESCAPYNPADRTCPDTSKCQRWYSENYGYIGGYYGATMGDGGQTMMEEMQNGPLAVGFMVLDDFRYYDGGIYVQSTDNELKDEFNPFVPVNHAVLAVGYGTCTSSNPDPNCEGAAEGTPYWIVKNSWGTSFGDQGFFYILRGVDEVGIESIVVKADVVPQM